MMMMMFMGGWPWQHSSSLSSSFSSWRHVFRVLRVLVVVENNISVPSPARCRTSNRSLTRTSLAMALMLTFWVVSFSGAISSPPPHSEHHVLNLREPFLFVREGGVPGQGVSRQSRNVVATSATATQQRPPRGLIRRRARENQSHRPTPPRYLPSSSSSAHRSNNHTSSSSSSSFLSKVQVENVSMTIFFEYVNDTDQLSSSDGDYKHPAMTKSGSTIPGAGSNSLTSPADGDIIGYEYLFQTFISIWWMRPPKVQFRILNPEGRSFKADAIPVGGGSISAFYQLDIFGFTQGNGWQWEVITVDQQGVTRTQHMATFDVVTSGTSNVGGGSPPSSSPPSGGSGAKEGPAFVYGLQPACYQNDPNQYNICLDLKGSTGKYEPWMEAFGAGMKLWPSVVTGDVPAVSAKTVGGSSRCTGMPSTIDDLYMCGYSENIDGTGGVLGSSALEYVRKSWPQVPVSGWITFDSADVGSRSVSALAIVVKHEMGHVLGLGSLWQRRGLYDGSSGKYRSGTYATQEWNNIGCSGPLPVETQGGPGTASSHWSENCLAGELMTGYLSGGCQLSRISVGSLRDLGYQVNYNAAYSFGMENLGQCGSYCPEHGGRRKNSRLRQTATKEEMVWPPEGGNRRQLSASGRARAVAYGQTLLRDVASTARTLKMANDSNVEYVGDLGIRVLYEEQGQIYSVQVSKQEEL